MDTQYRRNQAVHHRAILNKLVGSQSANVSCQAINYSCSNVQPPASPSNSYTNPQQDAWQYLSNSQIASRPLAEQLSTESTFTQSSSSASISIPNTRRRSSASSALSYQLCSPSTSTSTSHQRRSTLQPSIAPSPDAWAKYHFQTNLGHVNGTGSDTCAHSQSNARYTSQPEIQIQTQPVPLPYGSAALQPSDASLLSAAQLKDAYDNAGAWAAFGTEQNLDWQNQELPTLGLDTWSSGLPYQSSNNSQFGVNYPSSSFPSTYDSFSLSAPSSVQPDSIQPRSVFGLLGDMVTDPCSYIQADSPLQILSPDPLESNTSGSQMGEDHQSARPYSLSPQLEQFMDNTRLDRRRRSDTDAEFSRATPARGPVKKRAAIRSHLTHEEKLARAAATEGLSKGDKRRVQNKLAQRAFRARNKNSSNSGGNRVVQLEELSPVQSGRLSHMTALVTELRKENTNLPNANWAGGARTSRLSAQAV